MSNEIALTDAAGTPAAVSAFDTARAAERVAEQTLMRSVVRSVAIGLPIGIAVFVGILALAVGDDLEWWTILALGSLMGVLGAVLFGMLGGCTLAAHVFEDVDRGVTEPDATH